MKYYIKTFGCQQNIADSERIKSAFENRGMTETRDYKKADYIIINTCMVRKSAENRVYGLVENLKIIKKQKIKNDETYKIIITGCLTGLALKDKTGKYLKRLKSILPDVDEFMPIEEVGFDYEPIRQNQLNALVSISNGCNNYCTYCVVPYTRGREISRSYEEIIKECKTLKSKGYKNLTLLGQNVNSYGTDLINSKSQTLNPKQIQNTKSFNNLNLEYLNLFSNSDLGFRISTLFPYLLKDVAKMGFEKVDFISSNPWDFSDELIEVIKRNNNITRTIHLPVQSGDSNVLKRMNRRYTTKQYLTLISKIKNKIANIKFTTDIIVGFCGETDEEFQNTVDLCKKVGFEKAYISIYSPRPITFAAKNLKDDVPHKIKKHRWHILENLINKPHLQSISKTQTKGK